MPSAHTLAIQEKLSQPWIGSTPRSETWRLGQKGDCFSNGPGSGEGGNGTSILVTELALIDRRKLTPQKAGVELDLNSPRLCSPLPLLPLPFFSFFSFFCFRPRAFHIPGNDCLLYCGHFLFFFGFGNRANVFALISETYGELDCFVKPSAVATLLLVLKCML